MMPTMTLAEFLANEGPYDKRQHMHSNECTQCLPIVEAFRQKFDREPCFMEFRSILYRWDNHSVEKAKELVDKYPFQLSKGQPVVYEGKTLIHNEDGTITLEKKHCNVYYCERTEWDCLCSPESRNPFTKRIRTCGH
jgi:hypothetical protein